MGEQAYRTICGEEMNCPNCKESYSVSPDYTTLKDDGLLTYDCDQCNFSFRAELETGIIDAEPSEKP